MYEYLAAWRDHRKLTQEKVGEHLGVSHTTVGRWENGKLPVNSRNLALLAGLYGCTERQLVGGPPAAAAEVSLIDEVQEILSGLDPEDKEHWLATGRSLSRKGRKA